MRRLWWKPSHLTHLIFKSAVLSHLIVQILLAWLMGLSLHNPTSLRRSIIWYILALGLAFSTVLPWQLYSYRSYNNGNHSDWFVHYKTHFKIEKLKALISNRICRPWWHRNKQDPARTLGSTMHQNKWNKQQTFPFSLPLNDNFRTPQDKREHGDEKNRMARQTIGRGGAAGFAAICFTPALTMHLINWLFCFNAAFAAPPIATPRANAASKF